MIGRRVLAVVGVVAFVVALCLLAASGGGSASAAPKAPRAKPCNAGHPCPSPSPSVSPSPSPSVSPSPSTSPTPSPTPTSTGGWTQVLDDEFTTAGLPSHWGLYDGPYGSSPNNCATPSHVSVPGDGYMHMLMAYEATAPAGGQCGAGWYTAGMQLAASFAAINQRITVRWRMVTTDPANASDPNAGVISHNNMPMHWGDTGCWPANGEIDYMEGANPTTMSTFVHYGACGASSQVASPDYTAYDFRQWHTVQATRNAHTVTVAIDGVQVWSYAGNSTTVPDVPARVVLQQECRGTGCPATTAPTNTYTADVQVDSIVVENAA